MRPCVRPAAAAGARRPRAPREGGSPAAAAKRSSAPPVRPHAPSPSSSGSFPHRHQVDCPSYCGERGGSSSPGAASCWRACARPEPAAPERRRGRRASAARDRNDRGARPAPRHARQPAARPAAPGTARRRSGERRARAVFDPRQIRADRPYRLVRSLDGLLREFEYQIDTDRFLRIINARPRHARRARRAGRCRTRSRSRSRRSTRASTAGAVAHRRDRRAPGRRSSSRSSSPTSSAARSTSTATCSPATASRCSSRSRRATAQFSNYGAILGGVDRRWTAATLQAFRWTDPATGKAAYYDEHGRSLKRFFLKSPLKFEPRITSGFSQRRFHPVDQVYTAHLGVDYGAPTGSSVVAVAAGTVVSAGYSGAGGNMVHLKHAGGFETYYLHLSSFGAGVRAGAHVAQGQLVGRVGMTGSATGPHLDYRLKRNGVFVNPVSVHSRQAPGEPIPAVAARRVHARARQRCSHACRRRSSPKRPRQKPDAVRAASAKSHRAHASRSVRPLSRE